MNNRKIFPALFLAFALTQTGFAITGDVNGDNTVTIVDALMTAQYYVGLSVPGFNAGNADINGDKQITIVDALMIAQIYVGLITPPPLPTATPTAFPTATPALANLVVAQNGSGNYTKVQDAINAAPANLTSWFTILIRNGTYREVITVPAGKTYLKLVGESNTGTILTYSNCSSDVGSTSGSASAFFKAANFMAIDITFENTFDYDHSSAANKQAVAAEPLADRQVFENCRFTGHQDTLYVRGRSRQYFKNCFIQGNVDFIFGDATAVFDQCQINSLNRSGSAIVAPSTLAATACGLVFLNCRLTAEQGTGAGSVYLGRPWHPSSSTETIRSHAAFLYCEMGGHIRSAGWTSMSGVNPDTERMYEYRNTGAGAVVTSTRPQLTAAQAAGYTVSSILKGTDNWNPAALVR